MYMCIYIYACVCVYFEHKYVCMLVCTYIYIYDYLFICLYFFNSKPGLVEPRRLADQRQAPCVIDLLGALAVRRRGC